MNRYYYHYFAMLGLLAAIQAIALFLFCFGFFPQRTPLNGFNSLDQFPSIEHYQDVTKYLEHGITNQNHNNFDNYDNNNSHRASINIPESPFDKLIIMVVDSLRSDFVFGSHTSHMNYTRYLLHTQQAIGFVAKAQAPTVTLARIKDTVEVDNNVTRHVEPSLKNHNDWDTIIFHYLGLDHVGHLEGPKSLLMKPKQQEMDGIVKIIHEHLTVIDKGRDKSTLFLLCSDHGMNEVGNHGGSSEGEISPVFIFMSSLFNGHESLPDTQDYTQLEIDHLIEHVNQVDLAPTISLLYRLPIPKNSLGKLIYPFINFIYQQTSSSISVEQLSLSQMKTLLRYLEMNSYQQYCILQTNTVFWNAKHNQPQSEHIKNVVEHYYNALHLHKEWLDNPSNKEVAEKAIKEYRVYLEQSQSEWQHYLCSTDVILLWDSVVLFALNAMALLCFATSVTDKIGEQLQAFNLHGRFYPEAATIPPTPMISFTKAFCGILFLLVVAGTNYIAAISSEEGSVIFRVPLIGCLVSIAFLLVTSVIALYWSSLWKVIPTIHWTFHKLFVIGAVILHLVSMAGSSTVEEEHQTWYFISITWYITTYFVYYCKEDSHTEKGKRITRPLVYFGTLGIVTRVIRNYNASGNKYLGAGLDIATIIANLSHYHPMLLPGMIILSTSSIATYGIILAYRSRSVMGLRPAVGYQLTLLNAAVFTIIYKCGYLADIVTSTQAARVVFASVNLSLIIDISAPYFRQVFRRSTYLRRHEMAWCSITILFILLHKPHNSFLILLLGIQAQCVVTILRDLLKRNILSTVEAVVVITWFGEASFYSFGNSNSFATIDISGGYTGLTTYNEYAVGLLVGLIALSGPLMFLNALCRVLLSAFDSPGVRAPHFSLLNLSQTTLIACCTILGTKNLLLSLFSAVLTHLRHHLFVWSVFSPKYIYLTFFSLVDFIKIIAVIFSAAYARNFWNRTKSE